MEVERVRRHTAPEVNYEIDEVIRDCVQRYAFQPPEVISRRIVELDREFDIERTLQTNAALLSLGGVALAITGSRSWLAVPTVILGFLLLHATQGWCPPVPFLRRRGIRTRSEIERERFILKFLRGDFHGIDIESARRSPDTLVTAAAK